MKFAATALLLLLWLCFPCPAQAEDGSGPRIPLLDEQRSSWQVVGENLRSNHEYGDFVLEFSWRSDELVGESPHLLLRARPREDNPPSFAGYQLDLSRGEEGNLIGVAGARSTGLVRANDWNHLRLVVQGDAAELFLNDQLAWKVSGIESSAGYLVLPAQLLNGSLRDLFITELGYKSLLDGELSEWEGAGQPAELCWRMEDNQLLCTGDDGPWLRSREQYADFDLRLQYRLQDGGNSGVYVRVPEDGNHHGAGAGVEVQILDDRSERYRELQPYQYSGSVYKIAPATEHVTRAAGEWNELQITCRGSSYRVVQNGTIIVDATAEEFPELAERRLSGYLGLQNHSEPVWFRHVRIRSIGPATR